MPEKKQTGRESEKEQIGHLRGQAGGSIGGCFPNQAAQHSPDKSEIFHLRPRVYFAGHKYPLNFRPLCSHQFRPHRLTSCEKKNPDPHRRFWRGSQ